MSKDKDKTVASYIDNCDEFINFISLLAIYGHFGVNLNGIYITTDNDS